MTRNLLFVCTGNTCRSPMAEGLAADMLSKRLGVEADQLQESGINVGSAGVFASGCSPASPEAVDVMAQYGVDITNHRSTKLTVELIGESELILCMTAEHRQLILDIAPSAIDKTERLADQDIADPIGAGPHAYKQTANQIAQGLSQRLKEWP